MLKTGQCVEYKPRPDTLLAKAAKLPPPLDQRSLAAYRSVAKSLPLAVPRAQNAGFWDWVKGAVRSISGALSVIPGPVGLIAKGVNGIF